MKPKADRIVCALLLVATLARFPDLGKRSLWFDEALSGLIAQLSTTEVLNNTAGSSHPPGYYFLLHLLRPMGKSEFALRFPSAQFSLLAVALVARIGHDFFDKRTARLATLGMAVSPFQVYYAQEARMYGLAIALSAGLVWAFLQAVQRGNRACWGLYAILTAMGFYVHYYIGLVVLALHLWLLVDWTSVRRVLPRLVLADGLALLAFTPQLTQFVMEAGEFLGSARWRLAPSLFEPLRSLHYLLFGHILPLWAVPAGLFLALSLFTIEIYATLKWKRRLDELLLIVVLLPIITSLAVSLLVTPIYVERSFAVLTPALVISLARCVSRTSRPSPAPYLGAALALLMTAGTILIHIRADPAKPPLREAIEMVAQAVEPTDDVLHLQDASYVPALYYDPDVAGVLVDTGQQLWLAPSTYELFRGRTIGVADLIANDRVWVVLMPRYANTANAGDLTYGSNSSYEIIETRHLRSIEVQLYAPGEE